jgi:integrase
MQALTPELTNLLAQLSQHLESEPEKNPPLLEVWDAWVADLDLPPQTKADHYETLRRQILKASPFSSDISWLLSLKISATTFNKKLGYLRACAEWAKSEGLLGVNPWLKVRPRKGTKEIIKPFSQNESARIIAGFEKSYPAWTPFAKFLLALLN